MSRTYGCDRFIQNLNRNRVGKSADARYGIRRSIGTSERGETLEAFRSVPRILRVSNANRHALRRIMQRLTPVSSKLLVAVKILVASRCAKAATGRNGRKAEWVVVRPVVDVSNAAEMSMLANGSVFVGTRQFAPRRVDWQGRFQAGRASREAGKCSELQSAVSRSVSGDADIRVVWDVRTSHRLSGHKSPAAKRQVETNADSRLQNESQLTTIRMLVLDHVDRRRPPARRIEGSTPPDVAARAELGPWQPDGMSIRTRRPKAGRSV